MRTCLLLQSQQDWDTDLEWPAYWLHVRSNMLKKRLSIQTFTPVNFVSCSNTQINFSLPVPCQHRGLLARFLLLTHQFWLLPGKTSFLLVGCSSSFVLQILFSLIPNKKSETPDWGACLNCCSEIVQSLWHNYIFGRWQFPDTTRVFLLLFLKCSKMAFHVSILTATHSSSLDRLTMAELPIYLIPWSCSTMASYFIQAGSWYFQQHGGLLGQYYGQRLLAAGAGNSVSCWEKSIDFRHG